MVYQNSTPIEALAAPNVSAILFLQRHGEKQL
jgi:hypothetical protein